MLLKNNWTIFGNQNNPLMDIGRKCQQLLPIHHMYIAIHHQKYHQLLRRSLKLKKIIWIWIQNYLMSLNKFNLIPTQFVHQLVALNMLINQNLLTQWIISYQTLVLIIILKKAKQVNNGLLRKLDIHGFGKRLKNQCQLNIRSNHLMLICKLPYQI